MPTEPIPALPKNFLRPCLLLLLREERAHGYDLLERIQSLGFDGSDPGGLYRALRALENDGLRPLRMGAFREWARQAYL